MHVIYVENDDRDFTGVADALKATGIRITLDRAKSPEELVSVLRVPVDLVIADVLLDDPATAAPDGKDRLREVIDTVRRWEDEKASGWRVPIIAYTGREKGTMESCIRESDRLYDILDKNSATYEYVAWRLTKLETELARLRPDRTMQLLIRQMRSTVSWHPSVVRMAEEYAQGSNEHEQIARAGDLITEISTGFGTNAECESMWATISQWEWLERAVVEGARGHARHLVNVFWLGHYLLNDDRLAPRFLKLWSHIKSNRSRMDELKELSDVEALAACWFYAGLFHDVGNCVGKGGAAFDHLRKLLDAFRAPWNVPSVDVPAIVPASFEADTKWTYELGGLATPLMDLFVDELAKGKVDSGVAGATHLRSQVHSGPQGYLAREASRAAALHNLFPEMVKKDPSFSVDWQKEPIVCLLIFCDQLQSWDRDKGMGGLHTEDRPDRAELLFLDIDQIGGTVKLKMGLNYIAPEHVSRVEYFRTRMKRKLEKALRDNPLLALRRLTNWPFEAEIMFFLDGKRLLGELPIVLGRG